MPMADFSYDAKGIVATAAERASNRLTMLLRLTMVDSSAAAVKRYVYSKYVNDSVSREKMLVTGEALKSAAIRSSQYKLLSVRICVATYLASAAPCPCVTTILRNHIMWVEVVKMGKLQLPFSSEITEIVLDYLADDPTSLKSCGLVPVCGAWLASVRTGLFSA